MRIVVFGNNVFGSLKPGGAETLTPEDVTDEIHCGEVVYHSWSCTIGRSELLLFLVHYVTHLARTDTLDDVTNSDGETGPYKSWGSSPFVEHGQKKLDISASVRCFVGFDEPVGYLYDDGRAKTLDGMESPVIWDRIAVTGEGTTYALRQSTLYRFKSFASLMAGRDEVSRTELPRLGKQVPSRLIATESRCLVQYSTLAFEVVADKEGAPSFRMIETLAGLRCTIRPGARNRFAITTEAGEAYLLDTRDLEPVLLTLEEGDKAKEEEGKEEGAETPEEAEIEEIRHYAVGSDFEVLVQGRRVLTRGSSECLLLSEIWRSNNRQIRPTWPGTFVKRRLEPSLRRRYNRYHDV